MVTCLKLGDVRIHRIIEQEAPFFELKAFFPALTDEVLEENLSWLQPKHLDPSTGKLVLCIQAILCRRHITRFLLIAAWETVSRVRHALFGT